MPKAVGEDALSGTKEHVLGFHHFTVTEQTKVIATGVMVGITPAGESVEKVTAKTTGDEGWVVKKGDVIRVYDVHIEFH